LFNNFPEYYAFSKKIEYVSQSGSRGRFGRLISHQAVGRSGPWRRVRNLSPSAGWPPIGLLGHHLHDNSTALF
jgi:hypothetical protein